MFRKTIASLALAAVAVTAAVPAVAAGPNLVQRAVAVNNATGLFNTVLAAATCPAFDGAVVDILSAKGQKTLFAPTDAAFEALGLTPKNVCEKFNGGAGSMGSIADLQDILLYHVTPGRRPAGWLATKVGGSIRMANGDPAAVTRAAGALAVDGARVVVRNVPASNGFIHAVDAVLLP